MACGHMGMGSTPHCPASWRLACKRCTSRQARKGRSRRAAEAHRRRVVDHDDSRQVRQREDRSFMAMVSSCPERGHGTSMQLSLMRRCVNTRPAGSIVASREPAQPCAVHGTAQRVWPACLLWHAPGPGTKQLLTAAAAAHQGQAKGLDSTACVGGMARFMRDADENLALPAGCQRSAVPATAAICCSKVDII